VQKERQTAAARSEWSWDRYATELRVPSGRLEVARALAEALVAAIAERDLPWQPRFRKGYVSFQRPGDYTVFVVDMGYRAGAALKVKLRHQLPTLGIPNPYPSLGVRWMADTREWAWFVPSMDAVPDVRLAIDLVLPYTPADGPMPGG